MITISITDSKMLSSVSYDEAEKILTVEFSNGGEYAYFDVPKEKFDEMLNEKSKGSYFLKNIKNNYKYEKK
jgi:hypothetical protein